MNGWFDTDGPVDSLPIDDRGLQYGDGLFETIAIRDGRPRLLERHLARLSEGCRRLELPYPGDNVVTALVVKLVDSSVSRGIVKLILTAGEGPRGYARPESPKPRLIGRFSASQPLAAACYSDGVSVGWSDVPAAIQPRLAGLKSLNRLEQVLARHALGTAFERLLCDTESQIICGTMSNIMLVIDQQLVTPDLSRAGVAGVMRAAVLDCVDDVVVRDIGRTEALYASELILCNSQFGVLPVASIDNRTLSNRDGFSHVRASLAKAGVVEP